MIYNFNSWSITLKKFIRLKCYVLQFFEHNHTMNFFLRTAAIILYQIWLLFMIIQFHDLKLQKLLIIIEQFYN